MSARVRVMVIDDSAVVRKVLTERLNADAGIEVIGSASDPIFALEHMKKSWPDVIVLDVEMPRMDGITFLRKLMAEHPTPVVICSTLTEQGAATTLRALEAGAVSVLAKPRAGLRSFLEDASQDIIATVKAAAHANIKHLAPHKSSTGVTPVPVMHAEPLTASELSTTDRVVVIGTSTGGTLALEAVLSRLPRVCPGIVVVQHMPEKFTAAFASRLDSICEIEVKEAANRDRVMPGRALIAPGGKHTQLRRSGAQYYVEVSDGPLVNRHRPSVDVLFRSAAKSAAGNVLGIIMTGMGDDGAAGLLELRNSGAHTIAQDEASCVVFGMPKEAIQRGAAQQVMDLSSIPGAIVAAA